MGKAQAGSETDEEPGQTPGVPSAGAVADGRDGADRDLPLLVVTRQADQGDAQAGLGRRRWRWLLVIPLLMLIGMTSGLIAMYFQPPGLQAVMRLTGIEAGGGTSRPIAVPAPSPTARGEAPTPTPAQTVVGLGRLIPDGDVVTVSAASGVRDARVQELRVDEGDQVEVGQVLAVLDNHDRLATAVEVARSSVEVQTAMVDQARTTSSSGEAEALAVLRQAQSAAGNARVQYERTQYLYERGIAAEAAHDRDLSAWEQAREEVDRANAALERYRTNRGEEGVDVVVAQRNLDAARSELHRAEAELEQAFIRSPQNGTVLEVLTRPGERITGDGIVTVGQLDQMMAEVEVYQTEVRRLSVGDPVTLTSAALPRPLTGQISRIGLQVRRQSIIDQDPAANTDARVVLVDVALDPDSVPIAARYTNLEVNARLTPQPPTATPTLDGGSDP